MKLTKLLAALSLAAIAGTTFAATQTGTMQVSASIDGASCVLTTHNLALGSYNPSSASVTTGNAFFSTLCTSGASWTATFSPQHRFADNTAGLGNTSGNGDTLKYYVSSNASFSDDLTGYSSTGISVVGTGATENTNIYAKIPTGQYLSVGTYTDTLTITLSY